MQVNRLSHEIKLIARVFGRKGMGLFLTGVFSSFILSGVEYSYAVFLMVFSFTLGFVAYPDLPSWLPFDVRQLSPLSMWAGLFVVGIAQATAQVATYQSKIMFTELMHARFRMALGYAMLKRERGEPFLSARSIFIWLSASPRRLHSFSMGPNSSLS